MTIHTIEKFYVIESASQYNRYCTVLEELLDKKIKNAENKKNIKLLTLLIGTWQEENTALKTKDLDPVEYLSLLLKENNLKQKDLAEKLGISKALVSDIMHYRRSMSKEVVRGIASIFKVSQEAFNKRYELKC